MAIHLVRCERTQGWPAFGHGWLGLASVADEEFVCGDVVRLVMTTGSCGGCSQWWSGGFGANWCGFDSGEVTDGRDDRRWLFSIIWRLRAMYLSSSEEGVVDKGFGLWMNWLWQCGGGASNRRW